MQTNTENYNPVYRDVVSEENVIQAIFINPELIYQIDVIASDFTHLELRKMYEGMLSLYADGVGFDIKSILDYSKADKTDVIRVLRGAVTDATASYHARILRNMSFNRECRSVVAELQNKLGDDNFMNEAEKKIADLYEIQRRHKTVGLQELISNVHAQINEAKLKREYGIPTGFYKLNEFCVGFCPRHLWLLGAYTSHGKSTLLSQIVDDVCKAGNSMVVFSVEDSKEDKLVRLYATKTGVPIKTIVRGDADEDTLNHARKQIAMYDLQIYDDIYTLEEMDMKIRKHKIQGNVDIVAVDFVQNIQTKGDSIFDRMSQVAIGLQKMAKKHNICILGLSQVSEGKEKGSISLRGAQELASSADIVLWIDRQPDTRDFSLIVRKNRPFGVTGKMAMHFDETWTRIKEGMYL